MEKLHPSDPRAIGPYRLLGRLGGGRMSLVYLGETPDGQRAAVRVIRAEVAVSAGFRDRFAHEVARARRVGRHWAAAILAADAEAPAPWVATEYVPGPSLHDVVSQRGPLPAPVAAMVARRLAGAIGAIHAAGLVHGDVEPANVLLSSKGPILIGFGFGHPASTGSAFLAAAVGTPVFLAPEHLRGKPPGPPTDVFGLGATLAYAVTGRILSDTDDPSGIDTQRLAAELDLAGAPEPLADLIRACLERRPGRRPTPARLAEALTVPAAGLTGPYGGWSPTETEDHAPTPSTAEPTPVSGPTGTPGPTPASEQPAPALAPTPASDPRWPTEISAERTTWSIDEASGKWARRSREGNVLASLVMFPLFGIAAVPGMVFPFVFLVVVYILNLSPVAAGAARTVPPRHPGRVGPATVLFAPFRVLGRSTVVGLAVTAMTLGALVGGALLVALTTGVLGPIAHWALGGALGLPQAWFTGFFVKLAGCLLVLATLDSLSLGGSWLEAGVTRLQENASELQIVLIWLVGVLAFVAALLWLPTFGWWPLPYGR